MKNFNSVSIEVAEIVKKNRMLFLEQVRFLSFSRDFFRMDRADQESNKKRRKGDCPSSKVKKQIFLLL